VTTAPAVEDGAGPAGGVLGLSYGEHVLVWSLRRMAAGRAACPLIAREFAGACGAEAERALAAFGLFFATLARAGRRRLVVAPPGTIGLSSDERLLLAVFASAQAGAAARLRAHLAWLARADEAPRLETAATIVGMALALNGHRLPLPAASIGGFAAPAELGLR
jgi:hypothetical protein